MCDGNMLSERKFDDHFTAEQRDNKSADMGTRIREIGPLGRASAKRNDKPRPNTRSTARVCTTRMEWNDKYELQSDLIKITQCNGNMSPNPNQPYSRHSISPTQLPDLNCFLMHRSALPSRVKGLLSNFHSGGAFRYHAGFINVGETSGFKFGRNRTRFRYSHINSRLLHKQVDPYLFLYETSDLNRVEFMTCKSFVITQGKKDMVHSADVLRVQGDTHTPIYWRVAQQKKTAHNRQIYASLKDGAVILGANEQPRFTCSIVLTAGSSWACDLEKTRPRTLHYHTQLRRRGWPWRSAFVERDSGIVTILEARSGIVRFWMCCLSPTADRLPAFCAHDDDKPEVVGYPTCLIACGHAATAVLTYWADRPLADWAS
ncbi:hypothetical protein EDB89DRAFT_1910384 [Lactarius sanguifluus]|nr:hypothetical protein EDB89DRAFT_1910384 [Lactarius sanguifluus]